MRICLLTLLLLTGCDKYKCIKYETNRIIKTECVKHNDFNKKECELSTNIIINEQECLEYGWVKE
jgi:hypothetical protein